MLNISENNINRHKLEAQGKCFQKIQKLNTSRKLSYWIVFLFVSLFIISLLPWTQNVRGKGKITTLRPEDRPQNIYPIIPGRIERWYVREGDSVRAGDTLVRLSEIKTEYFDPNLVERSTEQVIAKEFSVKSYEQKANALSQQILAMREALLLKLEQAENKVKQATLKIKSDSMDLEAAKVGADIAAYQFRRTDTLYQKGLKSLTEWEAKRNKRQETASKLISAENKLLVSKNEFMNARIELNSIRSEYADKIAKAESDRFSTLSSLFDAEGSVSKLKNIQSNYESRQQYYYILAPQNGIITKIYKKGLGETIKEEESLLSLMPRNAEMAVEMYIRPMDYPLLELEEEVVFFFDGWPAFVLSGWPEQSTGTFRGRIAAIDNVTSENNMFRILVRADETFNKPWPKGLRVGAAAEGTILLNNVRLWYEIWRQLNGFPPDYYEMDIEKFKLKAPIEQFKK